VKDEEEIAFEREDDALAESAQRHDAPAFGFAEWRSHRSEQKGASQPDRFQGPAEDAGLERREVGGDVGQLGHGEELSPAASAIASSP
jgi:hypothetical protein